MPDGRTLHRDALIRYATVDLATSVKTTADFTVICVVGKAPDGQLLVLDVVRRRMEGPKLIPAIQRAVEAHDLGAVFIEKAGFQLSIIQQARSLGVPVRELVPDKDKVARALPATARLEGGQILLPRVAPWIDEFIAEFLAFPNAGSSGHDDQVDALAYAVEAADEVGVTSLLLSGSIASWEGVEDPDDPAWDRSEILPGLPRGQLAQRKDWEQICRDMTIGGFRSRYRDWA